MKRKNGKSGADEIGILVAVYGTLMQGERNARWRQGIPTIAETCVPGVLYDTGYGFPAFVPHGMEPKSARKFQVHVEVLETDEDGLARMDVLEGYPNLYRRERIVVDVNGQKRLAWVYVMNRLPEHAEVIDFPDWRVFAEKQRRRLARRGRA